MTAVEEGIELEAPSGGGGGSAADHLQPGMALGKLARITKAQPFIEGDGKPPQAQMFWWWETYYTDSEGKTYPAAAANEDGSAWLLRDLTSTRFGRNPKTGNAAKARVRVEALLNREIKDDEPLGGLLEQCIGKPAVLFLRLNSKGFLGVSDVQPWRKGMAFPNPSETTLAANDEVPF